MRDKTYLSKSKKKLILLCFWIYADRIRTCKTLLPVKKGKVKKPTLPKNLLKIKIILQKFGKRFKHFDHTENNLQPYSHQQFFVLNPAIQKFQCRNHS